MSKDFDTTLSTAIDLAAGAALTAGAQAARSRGRKRTMRKRAVVTALSLVLVTVGAGAAFRANSSDDAGSKVTPAATACPSGSPSASANTYSGAVHSLLLPVPAGAASLAPRQGASGGEITLDQFTADEYPGDDSLQATATQGTLGTFGFMSAAVRWYHDVQGDDVEMYLIRFSGAQGAQGYGLSLASSRLQNGAFTDFSDSAAATGYGFLGPAAPGYTETDLYGYTGNIVVIMHVFSQEGAQNSTAASLFSSQYSAAGNAVH